MGRTAQISMLVALTLLPALSLPIDAQNQSKLTPRPYKPRFPPMRIAPALAQPDSADWAAIGNVVKFNPPKVILDEELESLTNGGKRHNPQWSKSEGYAVTRALATIHKAYPKLITDIGKTVELKKLPSNPASERTLHCYLEGNTLYFYDNFFKENSVKENNREGTALNLCAALLDNSGCAEAASHKDWLTCIARLQKAREFCEFLFSKEDLERLDNAMAGELITPTILTTRSPREGLQQVLASYLLVGPTYSPAGFNMFLETFKKTGSVSSSSSTFTQLEKATLVELNAKERLDQFVRELLSAVAYGNIPQREFLLNDFERLKLSKKFALNKFAIYPACEVYRHYVTGVDDHTVEFSHTMAK